MLTISPMLTVEQVAQRLGIDRDGVSRLIGSKQLAAVNVARSALARRPTWRIRPEDLEAFERARCSAQAGGNESARRKRRPVVKPAANRKEWF